MRPPWDSSVKIWFNELLDSEKMPVYIGCTSYMLIRLNQPISFQLFTVLEVAFLKIGLHWAKAVLDEFASVLQRPRLLKHELPFPIQVWEDTLSPSANTSF